MKMSIVESVGSCERTRLIPACEMATIIEPRVFNLANRETNLLVTDNVGSGRTGQKLLVLDFDTVSLLSAMMCA